MSQVRDASRYSERAVGGVTEFCLWPFLTIREGVPIDMPDRETVPPFRPHCRTIAAVAYDEELAARIRDLLAGASDVTEQKMFGGLGFLVGGNMAVAASGQGGILVRVEPAQSDALIATTAAYPMEMRGREMRGWLRVDAEHVRTKRELEKWVERGTTYARSLPAKR